MSAFSDDLPERRPTSGAAVASLILGILSLFCSVLTGIPAIILGILGLRDIGRSEGRLTGQGLAVAGLILGGVATVLSTIVLLVLSGLLLPVVELERLAR